MKTDDQLTELVLRIQSESEPEAAKILLKALKEQYFDGFKDCEKIALEQMNKLGNDLIKNVINSKL